MIESRVLRERGRRSRGEADRLVLDFEQSGLTRRAFCHQRGIALHTLASYRSQRRSRESASSGSIVPVELGEPSRAVSATAAPGRAWLAGGLNGGRRSEVEEGVD